MMSKTYEQHELPSSFTFRIVEMVKRIRIYPTPRTAGLPWGLSLAAGIMLTVLSLNPHLNLVNTLSESGGSAPSADMRTRGIPVEILRNPEFPLAASGQENGDEEEIRKVIEDFRLAWNSKDIGIISDLWSHGDDVRFIIYTTTVTENNHDAHGWTLVRQAISACFWIDAGIASFGNLDIEVGERGAAVILDSNISEPHSDKNFALLRKEDDSWKILLWDTTGLEAAKTGDETGEYVEIAFEAEDGEGAKNFISKDPDASRGEYIVNMGSTIFEFSVPVDDEYTIWGRTHAPNSDHNSFSMTVGAVSRKWWDVGISPSWVWNQMNIKLNMGPMIFELSEGTHTLSVRMAEDGTKLDALYITNNLSLWAEQIQRRFELTMGYIEEPDVKASLKTQGNIIATWGKLKR